MRALLVDDERLARRELRRLLAEHPSIEIAGEAGNADEAREALEELDPDLLFLDIQMPGESGFELLASLETVPAVIFTTAYDEYALKAFEVSALDYLVKPIDPKRLARSVARLLERFSPDAADSRSSKESALPFPSTPENSSGGGGEGEVSRILGESDRVFLRDGDRCWLVELGEIRLFESAENYTQVHMGEARPLILRSLNELEERLDPRVFFRANRSQILNLKAVRSIHPWFSGRLMARLDGGAEVVLSRRKSREFRERMSV